MERKPVETAKWDNESGTFSVIGVPAVIISTETFAKIQKDAEKILGDGAQIIFYEAGKDAGVSWASRFKRDWELNGKEFALALNDFYTQLGWGKFEIGEINDEVATIKVHNSFIASAYGSTSGCHFLCGYNAGIIETITGRKMDAEETRCIARGDSYCQFEVKPMK